MNNNTQNDYYVVEINMGIGWELNSDARYSTESSALEEAKSIEAFADVKGLGLAARVKRISGEMK